MTTTPPSLEIAAPQIVIIANGDTASSQANNKGHLFERFIARLFEAYGCDTPTTKNLNVRSNGYELDLVTQFTLSQGRAIAECKAYSAPLSVGELNIFYSKLCTDRFDHKGTVGWFVAIPTLTKDGHELARKIQSNDPGFKLITSIEIYDLVLNKGWIKPIHINSKMAISDEAILVLPSGVCSLAKQLDPDTRLPARVLVQRSDGLLSADEMNLLITSDYAGGLPVVDAGLPAANWAPTQSTEVQNLFPVVGSKADFEYQFPAAPEFFIGRANILAQVKELSEASPSSAKVIVLNAQSGWGKSSLALRLAHQVNKAGGFAIVFDTRTAASPAYVSAALRKLLIEAAKEGKLNMPPEASFASLQSTLTTLKSANAQKPIAPMLVFFDQFENVFRNARLTQEFRDLAIGIREIEAPIFIGFSWKTDLVGLTEGYPFQLRDEIRGAALVLNVEPFGPKDVGTLLGRLGKAANAKLSPDLRQRLREYSQGLPWLLKKLANHILTQLQAGTSEEELLSEALNIERLFEQDLATLEAQEIDAIKVIAREAPVAVTDIVERVSPDIIQSLVDQRLIVRVGERLDTYWDTFREFLISGKVAVEDTYILRLRALGTSNLLKFLVARGGEATAQDVATSLSTSLNVVFNASRELRQLGILVPKPGSLVLVESLRNGAISEAQIQERVSKSLRRHKVFSRVQELLSASSTQQITLDELAKQMPSLFPAMEASANTWRVYAIAFASWFDYSGLVQLRGQILCPPVSPCKVRLLGGTAKGRRRTFPQGRPKIAFNLLAVMLGLPPDGALTSSGKQKAITDLTVLGVLDEAGELQSPSIAADLMDKDGRSKVLSNLLENVPGGKAALTLLRKKPNARSDEVGQLIKDAYGLPWEDVTVSMAGSMFRAWAAEAGIDLTKVSRKEKGNY